VFEFQSLLKQNDFESKPSFDSNLELFLGTSLLTRRKIGTIDWKKMPILSHISLKDIVFLYKLMIYLMCWSLLYYLIKLCYLPLISLISSSDHKQSRWGRYMFNMFEMKCHSATLMSSCGTTSGASSLLALLLSTHSTLMQLHLATTNMANWVICNSTSL